MTEDTPADVAGHSPPEQDPFAEEQYWYFARGPGDRIWAACADYCSLIDGLHARLDASDDIVLRPEDFYITITEPFPHNVAVFMAFWGTQTELYHSQHDADE